MIISLTYDVDGRTSTNPNEQSELIIERTILLADDGSHSIVSDTPCFGQGRYVPADQIYPHLRATDASALPPEPTEAQRETLAKWHLRVTRPDDATRGLNAHMCGWAFAGLTPDQVGEIAGCGRKVYIA